MTKREVTNLAASVHQRLRNLAQRDDRPFDELFQRFAIERFLYRLSRSPYADRFVLKGALMLTVWEAPLSRPTKDIDLLGRTRNDIDSVSELFRRVCTTDVNPDGMTFDSASVRGVAINEDADYRGVRITLLGHLGVSRGHVQIDVGFGDVIVPRETDIVFPGLLDMPAAVLRGYSRESVVSEKLEAAIKLDLRNTRMRDIHDLWFLSRHFAFDAQTLAEAIRRTFANRGTEIDPNPTVFSKTFSSDPQKAMLWRAFIERTKIADHPGGMASVLDDVARFLGPILTGIVSSRSLDADWPPGGPWNAR